MVTRSARCFLERTNTATWDMETVAMETKVDMETKEAMEIREVTATKVARVEWEEWEQWLAVYLVWEEVEVAMEVEMARVGSVPCWAL